VIWAGGHGAEIVGDDGREVHLVDVAEVAPALDEVEADLGALVDGEAGWLIERKAASLAVHHRLADPERVEELLPRVTAQLESRRDRSPGFDVLHGKSVVELRPSGTDKGAALAHLAERHPDRSPLVLGDDTTDEDAFRAAIHHGGTGVLVADAPRETAAQHRLAESVGVGAGVDGDVLQVRSALVAGQRPPANGQLGEPPRVLDHPPRPGDEVAVRAGHLPVRPRVVPEVRHEVAEVVQGARPLAIRGRAPAETQSHGGAVALVSHD
jgi:hypothetical protein